jgi:hypothetical protein
MGNTGPGISECKVTILFLSGSIFQRLVAGLLTKRTTTGPFTPNPSARTAERWMGGMLQGGGKTGVDNVRHFLNVFVKPDEQ